VDHARIIAIAKKPSSGPYELSSGVMVVRSPQLEFLALMTWEKDLPGRWMSMMERAFQIEDPWEGETEGYLSELQRFCFV
jgi:hypothetical protein